MYKIRASNDIISFENQECTCFGSAKTAQEPFLAKPKTFEVTPTLYNNQPKPISSDLSFLKNSFKKSLKRNFVPLAQNPSNSPTSNDTPLQSKSPNPVERPREVREFLSPQSKGWQHSPQSKGWQHSPPTYLVPSEPVGTYYAVAVPQQFVSCKNIQQPASSHPLAAFRSPAKPITINYSTPSLASPQKRTFSPISTTRPPTTTAAKQEREDQLDQSQTTNIVSKITPSTDPLKDETTRSCVRFATLKRQAEAEVAKAETGKSVIGGRKHEARKGQAGRSRIEVRSLRDQKTALKKMADVEEIYSQADSEDVSDSDKESVVLGRLNEYGSMIEPVISHGPDPRIVRFNSLAVTLQDRLKADQLLTY